MQVWAKCGHAPLLKHDKGPASPVFSRGVGAFILAVTVGFEPYPDPRHVGLPARSRGGRGRERGCWDGGRKARCGQSVGTITQP